MLSKGSGVLCLGLFMLIITGCQSTTGKMADETINDASISAAVQAKLTSDRVSNFLHVDVNAKRGIVTLSGIVESTAQRDQAERLARQVKGVLRVHNTLQIQSHSPGGIPTQPNYTHDTKSN